MLTHEKLVELYRELKEHQVLSVYIDADQHDPAERNKWRVRLDQEVTRCRRQLDGDQKGLLDFEQAWARLKARLERFDAFVPERGWVGFATAGELWYAENVPVPMPDGVYWEKGIRVAPYVRGLKQERPMVAALLDSERARVFRFRGGELTELEDLRADTFLGDLTDADMSKRATRATGMRGSTGTDTAQRALSVATDRMVKHLMEVVSEATGPHGFLVLGGPNEMVARASAALPKALGPRTLSEPSPLHVEMRESEVREALDRAASLMSSRWQEELLGQVIDAARAGGRACLGRQETERALREMRVDTLFLSRTLVAGNDDFADACVGAAFAQDAMVEELSGAGADRLDLEGEGMAARLRFQVRQNGGPTHAPGDESRHHP